MGMAVGIVADVVYTAVVSYAASKVVTKVATALGADEKTANLLGSVAGIAAGYSSMGEASNFLNGATGSSAFTNPLTAIDAPNAAAAPVVKSAGVVDPSSGVTAYPLTDGGVSNAATLNVSTPPVAEAAKGFWNSNAGQTIMAGSASGLAQGYAQGAAIEDAEKIKDQRIIRAQQVEQDRINKWKDSSADIQANMTQSVAAPTAQIDLPQLAMPSINQTPQRPQRRGGMLSLNTNTGR